MDYIQTIIERLNESILRNAKKNNSLPSDIAVLIFNDNPQADKIEPKYGIMVKGKVIDEKITFNKLLNIVIDPFMFLGGSKNYATPFIIGFMQRKSKEHNIPPIEINLRITINENYEKELSLYDEQLKSVAEYSREWEAINNKKDLVRSLRAWIYRNSQMIKEMKIDEILQKA